MATAFEPLAEEILASQWEHHPVGASGAGLHEYDHLLGDWTREARAAALAQTEANMARLQEFLRTEGGSLTAAERHEAEHMASGMEVSARLTRELAPDERSPSGWIGEGIGGVYMHLMREYLPVEPRAEAIAARLEQVPRVLAEGRALLGPAKEVPAVWAKVAAQSARGGAQLFTCAVPGFAERSNEHRERILAGAERAAQAMEEAARYLEEEVMPHAQGAFAIGRELFTFLLKRRYQIADTIEELMAWGEELLQETKQEAERVARSIDPDKDWLALVEELKGHHPSADQLLEAYAKEMTRARDFVVEEDLMALPENEAMQVVETPPFARHTMPIGGYNGPPTFEKRKQGFFWVTPIRRDLPPEQQERQLRDHSYYWLPIIALHEAYPGHHLQISRSQQLGPVVRKLAGTTTFVEGWALYCEEMMHQAGFYGDPRTRLFQLKAQMWRACRVIVDCKLHAGGMTFDQAVDFLVEHGKLERPSAIGEVNRYTHTPTYPLCYAVGKREILRLMDEWRAKQAGRVSLKEFHDRLLSIGALPIPVVKEELFSQ